MLTEPSTLQATARRKLAYVMARRAVVRLFGVPELVTESGDVLRVRTKKQLGVLLYLALDGRDHPVTRDFLVDLLWEHALVERGRHSLAQACTEIRRVLGRDALHRVPGGLRLGAVVETDLDRLADLATVVPAAERLRGIEPLAQADQWAGARFANWVDGVRARCRRQAAMALVTAITGFRRRGQIPPVHVLADTLYELEPVSDIAVQALAERALMRGDVIEAIRLLREHLDGVRETLGCNPQPELERLLRRLEAGSYPPVELVPPRLAKEAKRIRPAVFVGREDELAQLEAEWEKVRAGAFRTCLIEGPGGIGKSTLVRRFAASLAARAQSVFVVTCQEIGVGIPYAAISDLVTALSRDPSVGGTDPRWLAEVSRIHPGLRTTYPGIPDPPPAPAEVIRLRVAEGVLEMLRSVGDGGPALIAFDDFSYMDNASFEVMHVVAGRLDQRGILLLGTARTGASCLIASSTPSGASLFTWQCRVSMKLLRDDDTLQLVESMCPPLAHQHQEIGRRIVAAAQGNPHYAELLVTDWENHASRSLAAALASDHARASWEPPDSFRKAFARLYEGTSEASRRLLQTLAVSARGLTSGELATTLGMDGKQLDREVLSLLERGLIRLDGILLAFKNPLHRAYVYFATPIEERRYIHARLTGSFHTAKQQPEIARLLELGYHYRNAGQTHLAAQTILVASPFAVRQGAAVEVESAIGHMLAEDVGVAIRLRLLPQLAAAYAAQGKFPQALAALAEFEQSSRGFEDAHTQAVAAVIRAQVLQRSLLADDATVRESAENAVLLARECGDPQLITEAAQAAIESAFEGGLQDTIEAIIGMLEHLDRRAQTTRVRGQVLLSKAYCEMSAGHFADAKKSFLESITVLNQSSQPSELARALNGLGICQLSLGTHVETLDTFKRSLSIARELHDLHHETGVISNIGVLYEEYGLLDEARSCYRLAYGLEEQSGVPRRIVMTAVNCAHIAVIAGEFQEAREYIGRARRIAIECQAPRLSREVSLVEVDLLLATGEPELAWSLLQNTVSPRYAESLGIDTNGKAARLFQLFAWTFGGPEMFRITTVAVRHAERRFRLADRLESQATRGWIQRGLDDAELYRTAIEEVRSRGLAGVSRILRRFNLGPLSNEGPVPTTSGIPLPPVKAVLEADLPSRKALEDWDGIGLRSAVSSHSPRATSPLLPLNTVAREG